jgi:hypothetical protein
MARVVEGVLDVGRMAGAEWWLQDVDELDPPKQFHTDINIQVRPCTSPWVKRCALLWRHAAAKPCGKDYTLWRLGGVVRALIRRPPSMAADARGRHVEAASVRVQRLLPRRRGRWHSGVRADDVRRRADPRAALACGRGLPHTQPAAIVPGRSAACRWVSHRPHSPTSRRRCVEVGSTHLRMLVLKAALRAGMVCGPDSVTSCGRVSRGRIAHHATHQLVGGATVGARGPSFGLVLRSSVHHSHRLRNHR